MFQHFNLFLHLTVLENRPSRRCGPQGTAQEDEEASHEYLKRYGFRAAQQ